MRSNFSTIVVAKDKINLYYYYYYESFDGNREWRIEEKKYSGIRSIALAVVERAEAELFLVTSRDFGSGRDSSLLAI